MPMVEVNGGSIEFTKLNDVSARVYPSARFDYDVTDYSYVIVMQYWVQGIPAKAGGSVNIYMDNQFYEQAAYSSEFGIHYSVGKIYDVSNVSQFSFVIGGYNAEGEVAGGGANGIYAF